MYDPRKNNGIDWHDLTAQQKLDFLIQENTWFAGILSGKMGKTTNHEQNVKIARRYVYKYYPKLWELVHGNGAMLSSLWPEEGGLSKMIQNGW